MKLSGVADIAELGLGTGGSRLGYKYTLTTTPTTYYVYGCYYIY